MEIVNWNNASLNSIESNFNFATLILSFYTQIWYFQFRKQYFRFSGTKSIKSVQGENNSSETKSVISKFLRQIVTEFHYNFKTNYCVRSCDTKERVIMINLRRTVDDAAVSKPISGMVQICFPMKCSSLIKYPIHEPKF